MMRDRLFENLQSVQGRISDAAYRSGRSASDVRLVAVGKKRPLEWVRTLVELGARDLGENFPQELWTKVAQTADLTVRWHLIGHLQSNKVKRTFPLVRFIHGVDSLKLLKLLDSIAFEVDDPPGVLLQVNTSEESSKHGWEPDRLLSESEEIASCRSIPIRGLMTMAAMGATAEEARPNFVRLRELRDALRLRADLALDDLSMGMSNDYEVAVEEGATLVRVGSALFEGL